MNTRIKQIDAVEKWEEYLFDKTKFPRQPWRDIQTRLMGPIVNGVKRHFIQYWNFINNSYSFNRFIQKEKIDEIKAEQNELKKFERYKLISSNADKKQQQAFKQFSEMSAKLFERLGFGLTNPKYKEPVIEGAQFQIQGLRSASSWSAGLPISIPENSIYQAYIDCIRNAEHYIYIENQYFISHCGEKDVQNQIAKEIAQKLIKKIHAKEPFLVMILIPLLPEFEGELADPNGIMMRKGFSLILKTIFKAKQALVKQVMDFEPEWNKYLKIFGMRTHCIINDQPVSEMIYVHSKMMIVDDKVCIIGSANINDRSMLGSRDSEIAVIMEQTVKTPGKMSGVEVMKSKSIAELRIKCWRSLFGFEAQEVDPEDPLNPDLHAYIDKQVAINDEFFWKSFALYPHESLKTIGQIREALHKENLNRDYYMANKHLVKGYAVRWPVQFLSDEDLDKFDSKTIQSTLIPTNIFA